MPETTRTRPHREVEYKLDRLGVSYISECGDFPPYQLDIYIPEWHIAIEVDGPTHAIFSKRDAYRDRILRETYGISTLRLRADRLQIATGLIIRFIEREAPTTDERKAKYVR